MLSEGSTTVMISWGPNNDPSPALLVYDPTQRAHTYIDITVGMSINVELSLERVCTGRFDDPSSMIGCPQSRSIESGSQCEDCLKHDFYWPLRAEYQGLRMWNKHYNSPHVVYLAAFGSTPKVGITHVERFPTRVIEQGADVAALIHTASNIDEALRIEDDIAKQTSITDRVNKKKKVNMLHKEVPEDIIPCLY